MKNKLVSDVKGALCVIEAVGDAVVEARTIAFGDPVGPPEKRDFLVVTTQDDLMLLMLGDKELARCKVETLANKNFMLQIQKALFLVSDHMQADGTANAWREK